MPSADPGEPWGWDGSQLQGPPPGGIFLEKGHFFTGLVLKWCKESHVDDYFNQRDLFLPRENCMGKVPALPVNGEHIWCRLTGKERVFGDDNFQELDCETQFDETGLHVPAQYVNNLLPGEDTFLFKDDLRLYYAGNLSFEDLLRRSSASLTPYTIIEDKFCSFGRELEIPLSISTIPTTAVMLNCGPANQPPSAD